MHGVRADKWDAHGRNRERVAEFRRLGVSAVLVDISEGPQQDEISHSYWVAIEWMRDFLYAGRLQGHLSVPGIEPVPIPRLWWGQPAAGLAAQNGGIPKIRVDWLETEIVWARQTNAARRSGLDPNNLPRRLEWDWAYDELIPVLIEAAAVNRLIDEVDESSAAQPPVAPTQAPRRGKRPRKVARAVQALHALYPEGRPVGVPYKLIMKQIETFNGAKLGMRSIPRAISEAWPTRTPSAPIDAN